MLWQSTNLYAHVIHFPFFFHELGQKGSVAPLTQLVVLIDYETPRIRHFDVFSSLIPHSSPDDCRTARTFRPCPQP
jgi:hypothetical protein